MTSTCSDERALIIENGWSQGSVIKITDVIEHIICTTFDPGKVKAKYDAHLMIISQDCDIVSAEQQVECLLMKKSRKSAPQLHNGHNPRKIQLECIGDSFWEIKADDILILSKEALKKQSVCQIIISSEQLAVVKQWKANRYTRTGLPEKFVELTRPIFSGSANIIGFNDSKLIERFSAYIASIRVYCEEADGVIHCGFILLYKDKKCVESKVDFSELESLFESCLLEPLRETDGLNLINDDENEGSIFDAFSLSDIMSDMEFSLGAAQLFPRYYFDYISFAERDDENGIDES